MAQSAFVCTLRSANEHGPHDHRARETLSIDYIVHAMMVGSDRSHASLMFIGITMVILLTLAIVLIMTLILTPNASARTITVDDDFGPATSGLGTTTFDRIQDAINASADGDTIRVFDGMYYENIDVNRSVSLVGNGSAVTTIDGGGEGHVMNITADRVNMSGFTVQGSGSDFLTLDSGIFVTADHANISNNICKNNIYGIYLRSCINSTITNTTCSSNNGNGIHIESSTECMIVDNTLKSNSYHGIYISHTNISSFIGNICQNNSINGIWIDYSPGNISIINNTSSSNNRNGIRIGRSRRCVIMGNTIADNSYHGIELGSSTDCTLEENTMAGNSINIYGGLAEWNSHTIDASNTMNGKPIHYAKNQSDRYVPSGRGQLILANCRRMNIKDRDYSNGSIGILVGHSDNITISNTTCSWNTLVGIYIDSSPNCTISRNTCSNNDLGGIHVYSDYNILFNNTCSNNGMSGIYLDGRENILSENTCSNNKHGIYVVEANNNEFYDNYLSNNVDSDFQEHDNYRSDGEGGSGGGFIPGFGSIGTVFAIGCTLLLTKRSSSYRHRASSSARTIGSERRSE